MHLTLVLQSLFKEIISASSSYAVSTDITNVAVPNRASVVLLGSGFELNSFAKGFLVTYVEKEVSWKLRILISRGLSATASALINTAEFIPGFVTTTVLLASELQSANKDFSH